MTIGKVALFLIGAWFGATVTILWLMMVAVGKNDKRENQ